MKQLKIKVSDYMGKLKLSQKAVSEATGIRATTISHYYHDTVKLIDRNHIVKLCNLFGCTVGELFVLEDSNEN